MSKSRRKRKIDLSEEDLLKLIQFFHEKENRAPTNKDRKKHIEDLGFSWAGLYNYCDRKFGCTFVGLLRRHNIHLEKRKTTYKAIDIAAALLLYKEEKPEEAIRDTDFIAWMKRGGIVKDDFPNEIKWALRQQVIGCFDEIFPDDEPPKVLARFLDLMQKYGYYEGDDLLRRTSQAPPNKPRAVRQDFMKSSEFYRIVFHLAQGIGRLPHPRELLDPIKRAGIHTKETVIKDNVASLLNDPPEGVVSLRSYFLKTGLAVEVPSPAKKRKPIGYNRDALPPDLMFMREPAYLYCHYCP